MPIYGKGAVLGSKKGKGDANKNGLGSAKAYFIDV